MFIQYRIFSEEVISKIGNLRKKIVDFGAAGQIRTAHILAITIENTVFFKGCRKF